MKLIRSLLLATGLAVSLAGCTYSDAAPDQESRQSAPPSSSNPSPTTTPVTLRGKFQSQGAVTSGTATISVSGTGAVLQLEDFATGPGGDLRLALSPGTLSPSPNGELELSSSTLIELAPLSQASSQRVDMDSKMWGVMPEPVRSVVIYNYGDKTAYGTGQSYRDTGVVAGSVCPGADAGRRGTWMPEPVPAPNAR